MSTERETDPVPSVEEVVSQLLKLGPEERGAALALVLKVSGEQIQKSTKRHGSVSQSSTRVVSESRSPMDSSESSNEGPQTSSGEGESAMPDEGSEGTACDNSLQEVVTAARYLGAQHGLSQLVEHLASGRPQKNISKFREQELLNSALILKGALFNLQLAAHKFTTIGLSKEALEEETEKIANDLACAHGINIGDLHPGMGKGGSCPFGQSVPHSVASERAWDLEKWTPYASEVPHISHHPALTDSLQHYQPLDQYVPRQQLQQQTEQFQLREQTRWIPQEEFYPQYFQYENPALEGQYLRGSEASDAVATQMGAGVVIPTQQYRGRANEFEHVSGCGHYDASVQLCQFRNGALLPAAKTSKSQVGKHSSIEMQEGESLQTYLRALQSWDPKRILMARKLNRLGFDSPKLMLEYFSQFGVVDDVLVPHYYVYVRGSEDHPRLRPSSIGFVVMADPAGADAALRLGTSHVLQGKPIKISAFEHRLGVQSMDSMENGDDFWAKQGLPSSSEGVQDVDSMENVDDLWAKQGPMSGPEGAADGIAYLFL